MIIKRILILLFLLLFSINGYTEVTPDYLPSMLDFQTRLTKARVNAAFERALQAGATHYAFEIKTGAYAATNTTLWLQINDTENLLINDAGTVLNKFQVWYRDDSNPADRKFFLWGQMTATDPGDGSRAIQLDSSPDFESHVIGAGAGEFSLLADAVETNFIVVRNDQFATPTPADGSLAWVDPTSAPHNAVGDGVADDRAAMLSADAAAGSDGNLYVEKGKTYLVSTSATFDSLFRFDNGAKLSVPSGQTVTLNRTPVAGRYQIFTGDGTPLLMDGGTYYPEWWGVKADNVTDDSAAFQKMLDSIKSLGDNVHATVLFQGDIYLASPVDLTVGVDFDLNVIFDGQGRTQIRTDQAINVWTIETTFFTSNANVRQWTIQGFYFNGDNAARSLLKLVRSGYGTVQDCIFSRTASTATEGALWVDGEGVDTVGAGVAPVRIINNTWYHTNNPLLLQDAQRSIVMGNNFAEDIEGEAAILIINTTGNNESALIASNLFNNGNNIPLADIVLRGDIKRTTIIGNYFGRCDRNKAILLEDTGSIPQETMISNNRFSGISGDDIAVVPIHIEGAVRTVISGNYADVFDANVDFIQLDANADGTIIRSNHSSIPPSGTGQFVNDSGTNTLYTDSSDIATKTGTETLTNKTLTSPTVNFGNINSATITSPIINTPTITDATVEDLVKGTEEDWLLTGAANNVIRLRINDGTPRSIFHLSDHRHVTLGNSIILPDSHTNTFHIKGHDADTLPALNANTNFVISRNGSGTSSNANMAIISGTAGAADIRFGDTDNEARGRVLYNNNLEELAFHTSGAERASINSTGLEVNGTVSGGIFSGASYTLDDGARLRDTTTTPEGTISGNPGELMLATDGNAYLKETGAGATGWRELLHRDSDGNFTDTGFIQYSTTTGITASTTQTQGQQPLTTQLNVVATVSNENDVVTLPSAATGRPVIIINNSGNTLQIFPASGDDLGQGLNASTTLATGGKVTFHAYDTTNWR